MKEKKISKEIEEKILNFFNKGQSLRGIARETGFSQTFITNFLNKRNILKNGYKKIESRFLNDISYEAVCKKTGKIYEDYLNSSGKLTSHIKDLYPNFILESKFLRKKIEIETGKFWYEDFFIIRKTTTKEKDKIRCLKCDWSSYDLKNQTGSLTKHIIKDHNIEINEYLKEFKEQDYLFKKIIDKRNTVSKKENHIVCKICNESLKSITNTHMKKHGISIKKYKELFGDTINSKNTLEKLKTNSGNVKNFKFKNTKIEILISNKLNQLDIEFIPQKHSGGFIYDFFIPEYDIFIECDGIYWHGHDRNSNWHYSVFNNVINDYKKTIIKPRHKIYRLIEDISITESKLSQVNSKDEFFNFITKENFLIENHQIFNLKENDIIFSIDRCIKNKEIIDNKTKETLINNIVFLWKNFYNQNLYEKFVQLENRKNEFELKGIFFKEFYTAKKIGNKNIKDFFIDEESEVLKKVVEYRLGFNKSNEYFDLNIKNLYRGLEVRSMFNVGIFPIKQSKEIFEKFVTNENSKIYDPFVGWGSRLVSTKNLIENKNCSYFGNDLNKNLEKGYNIIKETKFKKEHYSKINIDFTSSTSLNEILINNIDFIFTSPPFYNDEIYCEDSIIYKDLKDWEENLLEPVFINCFSYLKKNTFIVIDIKELYKNSIITSLERVGFTVLDIEYYKVKKSHYTKNEGKNQLLIIAKKL